MAKDNRAQMHLMSGCWCGGRGYVVARETGNTREYRVRIWHEMSNTYHVMWAGFDVMTEHGKPMRAEDEAWGA